MIFFILDNIYNSQVSNGIFFRYQNLISFLLENNYNVTLITRYINNIKYPDKLLIKYIPFINYYAYPELYIPTMIGIEKLLSDNAYVITLLEYSINIISLLPKNINLVLGYHTRLDIYTKNTFFRKLYYNFNIHNISKLKPKLILVSGYSTISIIEKYTDTKCLVWYDMNSKFLEYPIIQKRFNKNYIINMIYTGRIASEKKIENLIEIIYKYNKYYGKAKLTLYGTGPDIDKYKNMLLSYDKEYPSSNLINFYGLVHNDKLYEEYSKYSNQIFIFASTSETLGKSPIEASLCGLPVFTAISDETQYIYKDNVNGFLFTSTDECCKKINYFMNLSHEKQNEIIKNGKSIKNIFNNKKIYMTILSEIEKITVKQNYKFVLFIIICLIKYFMIICLS